MIDYERNGTIATITINRPEARNAVNTQWAAEMEAILDDFEADEAVRVAVLRAVTVGERRVFCAGADLKAVANPGERLFTERGGFGGFVYRQRSKPVIAAVDGLATAGGLEIVLACDIVVASPRSSFGLAEVKRNLIAAAGGLFRLPRAIGQNVAMEVILTGEPLGAERAYQLGLVNHLVDPDQVEATALAIAAKIGENGPLAVQASRSIVVSHRDDDETLQQISISEFARMLASEDTAEGLAAFIEKRPPVWKGR